MGSFSLSLDSVVLLCGLFEPWGFSQLSLNVVTDCQFWGRDTRSGGSCRSEDALGVRQTVAELRACLLSLTEEDPEPGRVGSLG